MAKKLFSELNDNDIFVYNSVEYKKIPTVKISCCRSINSENTSNANQKIFVKPDQEVEIND